MFFFKGTSNLFLLQLILILSKNLLLCRDVVSHFLGAKFSACEASKKDESKASASSLFDPYGARDESL